MCDCFHLAFPNWHAASAGTGAGRRLRGPESGAEDESISDEPSQFAEGERPRPQGSSPVLEFPESEKYSDSEGEAENDPQLKGGSGKKRKKSGFGSMFEKRSTPKMSKLKEAYSPESGVIVKTAKDGCAEGLVYGGGGRDGIFIKEVVPESPASKNLKLKEGDQILSATVYFDNISYDDAVQILEHAQAYKLKLCLKRTPDIKETEAAVESDVILEEEPDSPEIREHGKTKRRGDARISWPKFPSLGRGRKSQFPRSHSSSEADEQRKLELSPTTSDTESPIKSQDALKGKKRHKIKFSALKKRGRISSSEGQETDTPSSGQSSGKSLQTPEDMLSTEGLESPSRETPKVYVTEELKIMEDLRQHDQQPSEAESVRHKAELITLDSTLKTTDLTAALVKSPDGKKKKKERSEFKMKIFGKDKSSKEKDTKAKPSPKRLKTLGASLEIPDQPENAISDVSKSLEANTKQGDVLEGDPNAQISTRVISSKSLATQMEMGIPKVELHISDLGFLRKSTHKMEEKTKKDKDVQQKGETKSTFKPPEIGLSDAATEITTQKVDINVEGPTKEIEQVTIEDTEDKEDPYEQLSKISLSTAQLPKREEIEIPGMEDVPVRSTTTGIQLPKVRYRGRSEEVQSDTVPLSIDVDSVKEAVSKLPGYKLPKVDTTGMPIPEEIIVIDANAQRISVKTPTKVVDAKAKQEAQATKFDINAPPEISKTTVTLPKMTAADLTAEASVLTETEVDFTKYKGKSQKDSETEVHKRQDIIIPGEESAQEVAVPKKSDKKSKKMKKASIGITKPEIKIPNIGIDFAKQSLSRKKSAEGATLIHKVKTETINREGQIGRAISDVKEPEIDGIEFIDSEGRSPEKKDGDILLTDLNAGIDLKALEMEGKERKFKMPSLNISMGKAKGPKEAKAEVELLEVTEVDATLENINASMPDQTMQVQEAELQKEPVTMDVEADGKGRKFKMPKFGIKKPKIKGPEMDLRSSKDDAAASLPKAKDEGKLTEVEVSLGNADISVSQKQMQDGVEITPLQADGAVSGQGSKFKMPKLGIAMPKVKGSGADLSSPKKKVDVTLQKTEVEVQLPDAELKDHSAKMEIKAPEFKDNEKNAKGPSSKFKKPSFKLPKFGVGTHTSVNVPDKSVNIDGSDIIIADEGPMVNIEAPTTELEVPSIDLKTTGTEPDAKGNKFKMPLLGFAVPQVKGPKVDISMSPKHSGATLPEAKADVTHPEVDLEGDLSIPDIKTEVELTDASDIAVTNMPPQYEAERDGMKFKLPKFGIKMPKIKVPEFDSSFSKKDTEATLQGTEAEVKLLKIDATLGQAEDMIAEEKVELERPEVEIKPLQAEVEGRFKMPKIGITMPQVKGPEDDFSFSKEDVDVTLPEAKAEINLLDTPQVTMDMKQSEREAETDDSEYRFKIPKFGISLPKIKGRELELSPSKKNVDINPPDARVDVQLLDVELKDPFAPVEIKTAEVETPSRTVKDSPSKYKLPTFKFPKFGIGTPKVSAEEPVIKKKIEIDTADIDIPVPRIDVPEVKAELDLPKIEAVIDQQPGVQVDENIQIPTFSLPNMSFSKTSVEAPDVDITLPDVNITMLDSNVEMEGDADMKLPKVEVNIDGQGSELKLPELGFKIPEVTGPEIDLSLTKKDIDVTVPGDEVKLPDVDLTGPFAEVEIRTIEESPAKFAISTPSATVEASDMVKDVKIYGADMTFPEEVLTVDIEPPSIHTEGPSIHVKITEIDDEKDEKYKMPNLGFSVPQVEQRDLGLSQKDYNVTLQEPEATIQVPEFELTAPPAEVDIKAPEIKVKTKTPERSPSKFKLPTFKLPKFGITTPSAEVKVVDMEKDVKLDGGDLEIPEAVVPVHIEPLNIDIEDPSIHVKTTTTDQEGLESKFKMSFLGFSAPQVEQPDINLSLPQKDLDLTLSEAEVKVPYVEIKEPSEDVEIKTPEFELGTKTTEGSPSKFKIPTFTLPKFDLGTPSATVEASDMVKDVKIYGADMTFPEEVLTVDIEPPSIHTEDLSHVKITEIDYEKDEKYNMPSLGFSGPHIDLSLSQKDVDINLPEAEVKLPDVELKEPSADVEIKAPEIKAKKKARGESPLKFKMPTFKLPKFDIITPSATVEVSDVEKDVKVDGSDINIPKEAFTVDNEPLNIDIKGPSIHAKSTETDHERKGKKFQTQSLGFSGPDIDLSLAKEDIDVTITEAEVKLPDVELKKYSEDDDVKAPEIEVKTLTIRGSPSKFDSPTFKPPNFGISTPSATVEVLDVEKVVKIDEVNITLHEEVPTVDIEPASSQTEDPSIHVRITEIDDKKGENFEMPSLVFSGPDIDQSFSQKTVDVTLPEVPYVEIKEPSEDVEIKTLDFEVGAKTTEGSPSKFKIPTFTLPKFDIGTPSATVEASDMVKDVKIYGADTTFPEEALTVDIEPTSIHTEDLSHVKITEIEYEEDEKYNMPSLGFSVPQIEQRDIDLGLSQRDFNVTLLESEATVEVPEFELDAPSPEVDINAPEIKVKTKTPEGSPLKFRMPTFNLPKLGIDTPRATIEMPDLDKGIEDDRGDINIPVGAFKLDNEGTTIEIEDPSIHMKTTESDHERKRENFTMPSLIFSGPDIDLSLSQKNVDVKLPEAEVKLPYVEIKEPSADVEIIAPEIEIGTKTTEGSPSKFKIPTFTLPKFDIGTPSVTFEVSDVEKDVKDDEWDINIPKAALIVDTEAPNIDIECPSIDVKTTGTDHEGKVKKSRRPKVVFSEPHIDLSLSHKDVDIKPPEVEVKLTEVELEEPSADDEMKVPEIKIRTMTTGRSPSKFAISTPTSTVEVRDMEKNFKIDGRDMTFADKILTVDNEPSSIHTEGQSIYVKITETDDEKGEKYKMPGLGFSRPDIDLSLSQRDVDVTLPDAEVKLPDVELKEPSADVEIKTPDIEIKTKTTGGSPSIFDISTPSATVEVGDMVKDVKIYGGDMTFPEEVLTLEIETSSIQTESPSILMKITEYDHEGLSLLQEDFNVTLPESKATVQVPEVELNAPSAEVDIIVPDLELKEPSADIEIKAPEIKGKTRTAEGSPLKFKIPKFKLPKFGIGTPSATIEEPDIDKDIKIDINEEGLTVDSVDVSVRLPEAEVEVPEVELKESLVEIKGPVIDVGTTSNADGSQSKFKMPTFKFPKFGAATPKVSMEIPDVDKDNENEGAKWEIEGATVDIPTQGIDTEDLSVDVKAKGIERERAGSKFKIPNFGFSKPEVKGPEIDISVSEKDTDVPLPEAEAEAKLPSVTETEVTISGPDASTVEVEATVKRPNWIFRKFSFGRASATAPDVDVNVETPTADVKSPEVEGLTGEVSMEEQPEAEFDANLKKSRFSLPRFSFSKASVKEAEIIEPPHVDISLPEGEVGIKHPDLEPLEGDEGSDVQGSKFKLPKFGISLTKVKGPEVDLSVPKKDVDVQLSETPKDKAEMHITGSSIDTEGLSVDVKAEPEAAISVPETTTVEVESKSKRPNWTFRKFSFSRASATAPDVDLNLETAKADVKSPEAKEDIRLPEDEGVTAAVPLQEPPDAEFDANFKKSKFSLPRFSFSKTNVKEAEIKAELPHVDISLPEGEVKVKQPGVEIKVPDIEAEHERKPSKFKFPFFGIGTPSATVEVPDMDKDIKIDGGDINIPEEVLIVDSVDVNVALPEAKTTIEVPEVELKESLVDIKGPGMDVGTSNIDGSQSEFKMPTFKIPEFGADTPKVSMEIPDEDKNTDNEGAKLEIEGARVEFITPSIDTEDLSVDVRAKGIEFEESGSKFKLPSYGFSIPEAKGPEIDISASEKDADASLREAKTEAKLPSFEVKGTEGAISESDAPIVGVEATVTEPTWVSHKFSFPRANDTTPDLDVNLETLKADMKSPKAKVDICPPEVEGGTGAVLIQETPDAEFDANFKKSKFSLPRFSFSKTSFKEPEIKTDLPHVDISLPEGEVKVGQPEVEMKVPENEAEHDGQPSKFKLMDFSIGTPSATVEVPDIDKGLKMDRRDVNIPEAQAKVEVPEVELKESLGEIKGFGMDVGTSHRDGAQSQFKIQTLIFPTVEVATPKVSMEITDVDKDNDNERAKLKIEGATVDVITPSINTEDLSVDVRTKGIELEGSGSKFKIPNFGISIPEVKGPEIDITASEKDADVPLPEAKAETELPSVKETEVAISGPDAPTVEVEATVKQPSWIFRKFSFGRPSATASDVDLNVETLKVDVKSPEAKADVGLPEVEGLSGDVSKEEQPDEDKKSRFSLPRFSFSKASVKEAEIIPEPPHVDISLPEGEVGIKHPDLKPLEGDEGSEVQGSKFKFLKFGTSLPKVKGPEIDMSVPKKDLDVQLSEISKDTAEMHVTGPSIDTEGLTVDVRAEPEAAISTPETTTVEIEAKSKRPNWTFPKFSFSRASAKGPDVDVSLETPKADVMSPEAKVDIRLPEVEGVTGAIPTQEPPDTELDANFKKSKFSLPRFSFSKTSVKEPEIKTDLPHVDISLPEGEVKVKQPEVEIKVPEHEAEHERKPSRFKFPFFGIGTPSATVEVPDMDKDIKIDGGDIIIPEEVLTVDSVDVNVTLPEAGAKVEVPEVELKESLVEIKGYGTDVGTSNTYGSQSEFKIQTLKFPEFGADTPRVSMEIPDVDKGTGNEGAKWEFEGARVDVTTTGIDTEDLSVDERAKGIELERSGSKFKIPNYGFSIPEAKGPEIDIRLSEKDADASLPEAKTEAKLPSFDVKETEGAISEFDATIVEVEDTVKQPHWVSHKFSFSGASYTTPNLDVNVETPKVDIRLPEVEGLSGAVSIEEPRDEEFDTNLKNSEFSLPRFSFSKTSVKDEEFKTDLPHVDISLPEGEVKVRQPGVEIKVPEHEAKHDGRASKFELTDFGTGTPSGTVEVPDMDQCIKIDGGDINIPEEVLIVDSVYVNVTSPEAKTTIEVPEVGLKESLVEIKGYGMDVGTSNIDGSQSEFKMPTFKIPEFGADTPKVSMEIPDEDKNTDNEGAKLEIEGARVEFITPSIDTEDLSVDVRAKGIELEESGSKFKIPNYGFSIPEAKGPEIDIRVSAKDADVPLPEAKTEAKLPSFDVKETEGAISEFDATIVEVEDTVKQPNWVSNKFSFSGASYTTPNLDVNVETPKVNIRLPEVEGLSGAVNIEEPRDEEFDTNLKNSEFSLPRFSFSKTSVKEVEIKTDLPHVDISLPEEEVKVKQPGVEMKVPEHEAEHERKPIKFKYPFFGIGTPSTTVEVSDMDKDIKIDGRDINIPEEVLTVDSVDVNVTLPEARAKVEVPEVELKESLVEIKGYGMDVGTSNIDGSQSEFKMPTFKIPNFGAGTPKVSMEIPDVYMDTDNEEPKWEFEGATVEVTTPSIDTENLSADVRAKGLELEESGSKFKIPIFGISIPEVKGPEIDISASEKDVEVPLPEAKAETKLPSVKETEVAISGPEAPTVEVEATVKLSNWILRKFSFGKASAAAPDVDVNVETPKADVKLPEAKVDAGLPEVEGLSGDVSVEGQPDAEFNANFKKSRFSLPRFSFSKTSVKEAEVIIEPPHVDISLPEGEVAIKHPDLKPLEGDGELDFQAGEFKLPKPDVSLPKIQDTETDLNLPKKDLDVPLSETKAGVQIPDVEVKVLPGQVEIKVPDIESNTYNVEGSPSKLKMPIITLPNFEAATQNVNSEVSALDKSTRIEGENLEIPKNGAEMHVTGPSIDTEGLSVDVKAEPETAISVPETKKVEVEATVKQPSWIFRKFSFGRASAKGPDVDVNIETPKPDVKSSQAKVDVCLPEVEGLSEDVSIEEPPDAEFDANFKESKFSLPRFSLSKTSVKDIEIKAELPHVDISLPEGEVKVKQPGVEMKVPEHETEHERKPSKFELPEFGTDTQSTTVEVPDMDKDIKIDGGDVNIPEEVLTVDSFDVNVTLPEVKTKVEVPEVELKESLVEIKGPVIDVGTSNTDRPQSKFKMSMFKFPKFGAATPKVSMEIPDENKDTDNERTKLEIEGATVEVATPSIDTEDLSVDVRAKSLELEESGSKFKIPDFGISIPEVKGPEIDISVSEKDADVSLPEADAEAKLPSVTETEVTISGPDASTVEVEATVKQPSWIFRKFSFGRASATAPDVDVNVETPKVDVKSPEAKVDVCLPEVEELSGDVSKEEHPDEEFDANFKKSKFSLPRFSFSKTSVKEAEVIIESPHVDISLPEGEVGIKHPDLEPLEGDEGLDVQGGKFKLPKFGTSLPKVKGSEIDLSVPKKDVDVQLSEISKDTAEMNLTGPSIDTEGLSVDVKAEPEAAISVPETTTAEVEAKSKRPNWSFRKFSFGRASATTPDVDMKSSEAKVDVCTPEVEGVTGAVTIEEQPDAESDANFKKSKSSLPRFSFSKTSVKEPEIKTDLPHVDISLPEGEMKVKQPEVEMRAPEQEAEHDRKPNKFKFPFFGIGTPSTTAEESDADKGIKIDGGDINIPEEVLTMDSFDVNVTVPEAKAKVEVPEVELKESLVEIKGPEIDVGTNINDGSQSKFKRSLFKFPKFGAATPKEEVPDVDKNTDNEGAKLEIEGATVDVTTTSIDTEDLSVDARAKGIELEKSGSKFKLPKFGISMPEVKGPEIDVSVSEKDASVKETEVAISGPDAPTAEVEATVKQPSWIFRKFSLSRASATAPDVDVNVETPTDDVKPPEVEELSGDVSIEEQPDADKKSKFSLSRFSFSKTSVKEAEVIIEPPHVDISLPEGEVGIKHPDLKPLEGEEGSDVQGSKFKFLKFGSSSSKVKGPEVDLSVPKKDVDVQLSEAKAEAETTTTVEVEATVKQPSWLFRRFSRASATVPDADVKSPEAKVEVQGSTGAVSVKEPSGAALKVKLKKSIFSLPRFSFSKSSVKGAEVSTEPLSVDVSLPEGEVKVKQVGVEMKAPEHEAEHDGQPSKFKLPNTSIVLPKAKEPEEDLNASKKDADLTLLDVKEEVKLPKIEVVSSDTKKIDVQLNVAKTDKEEDNLVTSKEVFETEERRREALEPKEKESDTKQDTTKSPERMGWFKSPKFGLSSPFQPISISEQAELKDKKSPVRETGEEEISPTYSVQSSDAFADISSALTSEQGGLSLTSPTKVTVRYSDLNTAAGLDRTDSNIITSTTRMEMISIEPNLPEKVILMSSGVSSSSEDTVRLESEKIHIITSNIQATPEAQHAKLVTAVHVEAAGILPLKSQTNEAASWTAEDPQGGRRTIFGSLLVSQSLSERSESKETTVITTQITRSSMLEFSKPISGDTASSIQRLRHSVHSEKMRFFDEAEK